MSFTAYPELYFCLELNLKPDSLFHEHQEELEMEHISFRLILIYWTNI
jgi:hypothetical protein